MYSLTLFFTFEKVKKYFKTKSKSPVSLTENFNSLNLQCEG